MEMVQSEATAALRRVPFHLVDATDGITPETAEAGGQPQISKNGGAFVNTSAVLIAIGNGAYYVILTAAELNTLGFIMVRFKSAETAEFQIPVNVVAQKIFSAAQDVNLIQMGGDAQSATDLKDFADAGYDPATNKVEGVKTVDVTTTNSDMRGTNGVDTAPMRGTDAAATASALAMHDANLAIVNTNVLTVDTVVDAIKLITDALPDSGALTSIAQGAALAIVDTVVDAIKAVTDLIPDAGAMTSIATAAALAIVDGIVDDIKAKTDLLAFTAGNVHNHTKVQDNLALTAQQKLDVNTEVDIGLDEVIPEPAQGAPADTNSIRGILSNLWVSTIDKVVVNKTSGFLEIYNAAGVVIWKKAIADDGSIYTETKAVTGP